MKKQIVIIILILSMLLATGCSQSYIELTDNESEGISEYVAYLLLKHDGSYKTKLMDKAELEEALATPTPTATEAPEITEKPAAPDDAESSGDNEGAQTPTPTPEDTLCSTLTELYGLKKFTLELIDAEMCDEYKGEEEYFALKPSEGKKVCVLSFDIINTSKKSAVFSSKKFNVIYQLLAEETSIEPQISLVMNDLQFIDISIDEGKNFKAVLIFFIDKKYNLEDLKLRAIQDDATYEVNLNK